MSEGSGTGGARGTSDASAALRRGTTVSYRIRFDECGPDGRARTSSVLRYAQDVAWIHSDLLGFDRAWYAARGLAWVVRAVELAILAPIPLGSVLDLSTEVAGFRKVWARRRSDGRLAGSSEPVLWAHTDWVMTDTARGVPGRIPAEIQSGFLATVAGFDPGRVPLAPTPESAAVLELTARPQDLDPMGHVNNAAYVDYLEESLLAAGGTAAALRAAIPRRIRLEYLAPATPGVELRASLWRDASAGTERWAWRLVDAGGRNLAHATVDAG